MKPTHVEEIIGLLWAILFTQLQPYHWPSYAALTMAIISFAAAGMYAVGDILEKRRDRATL